jgi:hypothetical protein
MVGLPEDTGEESLRTAEELAELKPHFVRIYPLLVLRDTELARRMRSGSYRALELEEAVSLCTGILRRFEEANVPVIRIGLQEQTELGCKEAGVLAGPYHPSFGHLVRSSLFLEKVLAAMPQALAASSAVCIRIHPHDRALLAGHRGRNIGKIRGALQNREAWLEEDPGLPRGSVQCRVEDSRTQGFPGIRHKPLGLSSPPSPVGPSEAGERERLPDTGCACSERPTAESS